MEPLGGGHETHISLQSGISRVSPRYLQSISSYLQSICRYLQIFAEYFQGIRIFAEASAPSQRDGAMEPSICSGHRQIKSR